MLNVAKGILVKEAIGPRGAGYLSPLIGSSMPTEMGRYVAPAVLGAGAGALTGAATAEPGDRTNNAMLGGIIGGLGGTGIGHLRNYRIGDPRFAISGNKIRMIEQYAKPKETGTHRVLTLEHKGDPISKEDWERSFNNLGYNKYTRTYH